MALVDSANPTFAEQQSVMQSVITQAYHGLLNSQANALQNAFQQQANAALQDAQSQQMIGAAISYGELGLLGGTRQNIGVVAEGGGGHRLLDKEVAIFKRKIEEGEIMVFSNSWTGEEFSGELMTKPRLPTGVPAPDPVLAGKADLLAEYKALSESLGMRQPHLEIEIFRKFLEENSISVFSLPAVIAYMDKKAKEEAKANSGWVWRPVRDKDRVNNMAFGKQGEQKLNDARNNYVIVGVSDYYGPSASGGNYPTVYDQTIPLHALRKVAAITKEFGDKVKLYISDYAPLETIVYPDPFLLAVVPNPAATRGVGRFVIDFWDEPGFGLEAQIGLK